MTRLDFEALYERSDWYDLQHMNYTEDLKFYRRIASETGDPILELACGTGRITLDLAARGFKITGLDISKSMLNLARSKSTDQQLNIDWNLADVRSFRLNRKFNLIFFPFNSICHIHDRRGLESLFTSVRQHLTPSGRFVVAMFVPNHRYLHRDPSHRYPVSRFPHPENGEIVITENNIYDPATQINHIRWYYKVPGCPDELEVENNMRMFYPQEFQALLHYNGFQIDTIFGDYLMSPFSGISSMQIYVAQSA
ncbi:class I SAM-dependent methyltransferase [bacterium]|nr:class I SAM-dependent methyltransferase [candidate division CSSED10-310 bacterium]